MTLEDNYGEKVLHVWGNVYAQFSAVRQNGLEKRIMYSSLSLYVSNNSNISLFPTAHAPLEKNIPSVLKGK